MIGISEKNLRNPYTRVKGLKSFSFSTWEVWLVYSSIGNWTLCSNTSYDLQLEEVSGFLPFFFYVSRDRIGNCSSKRCSPLDSRYISGYFSLRASSSCWISPRSIWLSEALASCCSPWLIGGVFLAFSPSCTSSQFPRIGVTRASLVIEAFNPCFLELHALDLWPCFYASTHLPFKSLPSFQVGIPTWVEPTMATSYLLVSRHDWAIFLLLFFFFLEIDFNFDFFSYY
jgi:hypothetical protein